jgi:hypothetical protein
MKTNVFDNLMAFLNRLHEAKIEYVLEQSRDDALMVLVHAPGEYWEIEFLADGTTDVERYRSNGHVDDESVLDELFILWSDEEESVVTPDASTARN